MRFDKRETGRNRSGKIRFASDDYYVNLACLVVHSGVVEEDTEFLNSEWCAQLLDFIGVKQSGMELLAGYLKRKERVKNGKR